MAKTFRQMVAEAREAVTVISPQDAQQKMQDKNTLVIDVREPTDLQPLGVIPGAVNVPLGVFTCGVMMFSLSNATWLRLILWTVIGIAIYFFYGRYRAPAWKWRVT